MPADRKPIIFVARVRLDGMAAEVEIYGRPQRASDHQLAGAIMTPTDALIEKMARAIAGRLSSIFVRSPAPPTKQSMRRMGSELGSHSSVVGHGQDQANTQSPVLGAQRVHADVKARPSFGRVDQIPVVELRP